MKFVFFGSSLISITSLECLKEKGLLPSLVVTKPDSPQGRGLELQPTPVKEWAISNNIEVITPESAKSPEAMEKIKAVNAEVGILVSYGKIIPDEMIDIFPKGIVNLHPSLLPHLRGPAPIEFTILNDNPEEAGVSIMLLDRELDHGPIIAQKKVWVLDWPPSKSALYKLLSDEGAKLLAEVLPDYLSGKIRPVPQDHDQATFTRAIEKIDGEIFLADDPYENFLEFQAYEGWPGTYFFAEKDDKKIRVKVTEAEFKNGNFEILKVIPEGKKEMDFESFKRGL
ncbi:MAG TPA: methionyl-tRNA formyltransferase [Candidatus Paceibacterota bacterium]|nr:methionyl-tRNA formyltransferase [Candidatus Paceibacterota bacterium]